MPIFRWQLKIEISSAAAVTDADDDVDADEGDNGDEGEGYNAADAEGDDADADGGEGVKLVALANVWSEDVGAMPGIFLNKQHLSSVTKPINIKSKAG